jgi:hypothetical protein
MDIREIFLSRPHCLHGCQESEKMHVHDTESPHTERTYVQLKEQREVSLLMFFLSPVFSSRKMASRSHIVHRKTMCCSQGPATAVTRIIGQMPAIISRRTPWIPHKPFQPDAHYKLRLKKPCNRKICSTIPVSNNFRLDLPQTYN